MSNIQINNTQVNITINQPVQAPQRDPFLPPESPRLSDSKPISDSGSLQDMDNVNIRSDIRSDISSPTKIMKNIGGGALVGGTASTLAGIAAKGVFTEHYHKPTAASIGLGVAVGAGIGLSKIETGDQNINTAKNAVAGALIGGGAAGIASATAKAVFTERLHSPGGVLLGASLGTGIALANNTLEDETANAAKNVAAGALIGGSSAGIASSVASSLFTEHIHGASASGTVMGAALGTGIALMNNDFGSKEANNMKNVAAGALIGGGTAGLASATFVSMVSERLTGYSPVAAGLGAALGAGIAVLNMEE